MSAVPITAQVLKVGSAHQFEALAVRGGRWSRTEFPALCGLLRHPSRGWILYDTGYAAPLFDATAGWPARLYRGLLGVELPRHEVLTTQLAALGIAPTDIGLVLISHFHADHVAGLRDFPRARFIAMRDDVTQAQTLGRWRALSHGQFPSLLPEDFVARLGLVEDTPVTALPRWMAPFERGHDLLGDGSLLAVPLPGHSSSQMGLVLPRTEDGPILFAADACWSLPACRAGRGPSPLARLALHDTGVYGATFAALGALARRETALRIVPSHCGATWSALVNGRG